MDERDIMVSDYRVMALTDDGQLVFDWVNQDQGTVSFIPDESDHSSITDEVVNLLSKKGITIKDDIETQDRKKDSEPLTNNSDNNDVNNKDGNEGNNRGTTEDINPIETTNSEDTNDENRNEIKTENKNQQTHSDEIETLSFIVRMDNPHERQKAIDSIKNADLTDAIDRIKLTGPFEMTYKLTDSGIELITVEDLGTGEKIDS